MEVLEALSRGWSGWMAAVAVFAVGLGVYIGLSAGLSIGASL